MSKRVGVRELRQNLSKYLDGVKAGDCIVVTEHGRDVAQLLPTGTDGYADLATSFGTSVPVDRLERIAARLPVPGAPAGTTDAFLAEGRASRQR